MPTGSHSLCEAAVPSLRRVIALLDLFKTDVESQRQDRVCLESARANVCAACVLLEEYPHLRQTPVTVAELILKAELALAALNLSLNGLSIRLADTLLQETRVRLESLSEQS